MSSLNTLIPMSSVPNLISSPNPDDVDKLLNELPKVWFWEFKDIVQWEGFWFVTDFMKPILTLRSSFHARDDDVLLASPIKTGTTWLKALSFDIMHTKHDDMLSRENPHLLVPTIEYAPYLKKATPIDVYDSTSPRLLHTHLPYSLLPDSIKNSSCKIVYIARNAKDTLISMWHFFNSNHRKNQEPLPLQKAFECFCSGVHVYGPFFEHVVEYWLESQKRPKKILFLKYEELKSDPKRQVSKIAEFIGRPFEDEKEVDEVLWRCSFDRLKSLEINKSESVVPYIENKAFFRKGEVGDWNNYLTPAMEEHINEISRVKLEPFGLFL